MDNVWIVLLEILKFTVPALIVFLTVYFILKRYLDQQLHLQSLQYRQKQIGKTLPIKLQAYERLTLFLERISIPNLIVRLRNEQMTPKDLENALMIAVQKEFEHNVAQQVYVSEKLWQIIELAKDQILRGIAIAGVEMEAGASTHAYMQKLLDHFADQPLNPVEQALLAIKKEVKLLL